jgi:hypothetical protein
MGNTAVVGCVRDGRVRVERWETLLWLAVLEMEG